MGHGAARQRRDRHHDDGQHHEPPGPIEDNPIWQQDNVVLRSVGIDIGSSGTQVAFSRIRLRRLGEKLTSRYVVVGRETLFESPVRLTPYTDDRRIDGPRLGAIIGQAYEDARQHPDRIDTGVVILTGEALRRENAEQIAGVLAEQGGDFVCAGAGHHLEAMLAAYGSGAARVSRDGHTRILNIDIGGGTTKLALLERGTVLATAAVHVGGRLQAFDGDGRLVRLEPAGREHATASGFSWSVGDRIGPAALDRVAADMAARLVAAVTCRPVPDEVRRWYLTDPIGDLTDPIGDLGVLGELDGVMFSGGVAEYVYQREDRDFGDLGRRLGAAIRRHVEAGDLPGPLLPPGECMRATVLGAAEYTVQLSGNTCFLSDPARLLPRRNLQVVRPEVDLPDVIDPDHVATAIRRHLAAFGIGHDGDDLAVALTWRGVPAYRRIRTLAEGVVGGLSERIAAGRPVYLMLDGDIAMTLGRVLRDELGLDGDVLVIDGVSLGDFDYVDLGTERPASRTVPVTVKSLLFQDGARGSQHDRLAGENSGSASETAS
jgi:ethanolamine utilization protein EutA (predicted chaperonin)